MTYAPIVILTTLVVATAIWLRLRRKPEPPTLREQVLAKAREGVIDLYDATTPDVGQYDTWKHVFRKGYEAGDLSLDPTLAAVIRRQGYMRLAEAACPGVPRVDLVAFLLKHEERVLREAQDRVERNRIVAKTQPGIVAPSVEELVSMTSWSATTPDNASPLNPLT